MVLFILNTSIYAIKLLTYLIISNLIALKISILIILCLCLCLLIKFVFYPVIKDFGMLVDEYRMNNNFDIFISISIVISYICIFCGGIFYLRILNSNNTLNLILFIKKTYQLILQQNFLDISINFSIILSSIAIYLLIIVLLIKLFNKHYIKIHLYYCSSLTNFYTKVVRYFENYLNYITLISNINFYFDNMFDLYHIFIGGFSLRYHLIVFIKNIHYMLLIIIIIFDIFFNNFTLHYMYKILPFVFIFDIYLRACNFYNGLSFLYNVDHVLHDYLSGKNFIIFKDKNEIWIDYQSYQLDFVIYAVTVYLATGLNGKAFCQAMEGSNFSFYEKQELFLQYNYYNDWKFRKTNK